MPAQVTRPTLASRLKKCFLWLTVSWPLFYANSLLASASYLENPKFLQLVNELEQKHQFERQTLLQLFASVERKDSIIKAISKPAESKPWKDYRPIFVTEKRTQQGGEFWQKYEKDLNRAQQQYGVPAEIIVAIIGVETRYGRNRGGYRVIDALATLSFDYPKRAKFFRSELIHFLLLCREQDLDPSSVKGSYAGAMGYPQFISSSYRSYAVDFDGDNQIDLINNPVDAIGSVANYLSVHGWQQDHPIATTVSMQSNKSAAQQQQIFNHGLKPKLSVAELQTKGIYSSQNIAATQLATALELEGETGPEYWLGLKNFYVITRYNHSPLYAMAVYQLSQNIKQLIDQNS